MRSIQIQKYILTILLTLFAAANSGAAIASSDGPQKKITLLYTNDSHSRLLPFDKNGIGKDLGGIERRRAYFKSVIKENPAALILDSGDIFQGTPFFTFFKGKADIGAYSLCLYDAICPGNHDLDNGVENLFAQLKNASFPALCCNIFNEKTNKPAFDAFKIFERGGVKIAVIGTMGKESWLLVSNKNKKGLVYQDADAMAARLSKTLKNHADLVILLSHSGYEVDLKSAEILDNVDVIVGGHSHTTMKKPMFVKNGAANGLGGTLVLQAFDCGIYAGRLDLFLDENKRTISGYKGELQLVNRVKTNEKNPLSKLISEFESEIKGKISEKIGICETTMSSKVDMLLGTDIPLGSFSCDATLKSYNCDIAIMNSMTLRDSMTAGDIKIETILNIFPFDNTTYIFEMKGADIIEMMNYIAANFGKNESFQYGGITFTIDMKSKEARDIKIAGQPVSSEKKYKVAAPSYIAEGNLSGNILFKNAVSKKDTGIIMRDMIIEYIKNNKTIKAPAAGRINLIK